ncbi:unnamed protein product [Paramecium sonneborni]|uniref:C2H2-type domain-containing protein n=1 Tax=Paramecium sonneborni TaxID=65129 RepID=A0A8S1QRD1_9CILI|nr:unnamed protein product [Paramecium sonneborni]
MNQSEIFERFKLLSMTLDEFEQKYMNKQGESNDEKEIKEIKYNLKEKIDEMIGMDYNQDKINLDGVTKSYFCNECQKQLNSRSAMLNHQYFKHNRPKRQEYNKGQKDKDKNIDVDDRMDDLIILQ